MAWYWYLLVLIIAAAGTAVTVPLTIKLSKRFNAIDYPDGRRINTRPVPRLGGIALFVGIVLAIGVLPLLDRGFSEVMVRDSLDLKVNYLGALVAVLVIFAVGIIDDIKNLPARYKLLGQILAASIAAASGVLFNHFANPFTDEIILLSWLAYPITIFYLVAFANIINLIDGLDGLAAGIVAISGLSLFLLATSSNGLDAAVLAIALVGACLAFLCFNFYPARVFMGDSGSLMLGFTLGIVSLLGVVRTPALITMLVPVVIAGLPAIDTFAAIIRRLRNNKGILDADTEHMHHRFLDIGFDQRTTVLIMYALSALLALCAFLVLQYSGLIRVLIIVILLVIIIFLIQRLGLFDPVLRHHYSKRVDVEKTVISKPATEQAPVESQVACPSSTATTATTAAPEGSSTHITHDLPPDANINSSQL